MQIDYPITISKIPAAGGTATGSGTANLGDVVAIAATPETGYQFVEWTGDTQYLDDPTAASASLTMPAAGVNLTANFELVDYSIAISANTAAGGTTTGSGTANFGDVVAITATPETGYQFVEWTGDTQHLDDLTAPSASLTMPAADVNLTANFELVDYSIAISANTAAGGTTTGSGTANFGDVVAIAATPETGYQFVEWTGDTQNLDDPTAPSASLTVPAADVNLTANFELVDYAVTISANPVAGGTTTGSGTANFGDVVAVSASPGNEYQFTGWTGDTQYLDDLNSASTNLTMPAGDVSLTANFELKEHQLTTVASPAEGGEVSGGGIYHHQEEFTLTAEPAVGYVFTAWTIGSSLIAETPVFTQQMPPLSFIITAHFVKINYQLTLSKNINEGGTVSGGGTFNFEDEATVTAIPATGYIFVNWTDASDNVVSDQESFNYPMPSSDATLTANFDLVTSLTQTKDEAPMVWPNPFDTHINIGSIDNIKRIVIISQSGQIVYEKDNPDNTIITSGLKPGIYLIKIIDETGKITMSKLIKQ
ncbi:T9SS type A sorting domain-containing protein [Marinilabilia sp.]|uniref:InlB B-repeat-containing protein n=1 Tax=Marinilabilia sp. TaxID=2021252 RepID=UPI0025C2C689|nr:T9SS type A sorting domain-containing protein [Marinilabilia sp.]